MGNIKVNELRCRICGKTFSVMGYREIKRKACSRECLEEWRRRWRRAYYKKHRTRINELRRAYIFHRYHSDPLFRKHTLDYQVLRRVRLKGKEKNVER